MHKSIRTLLSTVPPRVFAALFVCLSSISIHAASTDEATLDREPQTTPIPSLLNAEPNEAIGNCFASLNTPVVSFSACERALLETAEFSPQRAQVHSALAMLYAQRNNLAAARTEIDAALLIAAGDNIVQGNLGNLLIREGNYNGAIEVFNQLLFNSPEQAALYLNRSLALRAIGRYDEASKDYAVYLNLLNQSVPRVRPSPAELETNNIQSNAAT